MGRGPSDYGFWVQVVLGGFWGFDFGVYRVLGRLAGQGLWDRLTV